eukprot:2575826-Rhodomonas_salina.2
MRVSGQGLVLSRAGRIARDDRRAWVGRVGDADVSDDSAEHAGVLVERVLLREQHPPHALHLPSESRASEDDALVLWPSSSSSALSSSSSSSSVFKFCFALSGSASASSFSSTVFRSRSRSRSRSSRLPSLLPGSSWMLGP